MRKNTLYFFFFLFVGCSSQQAMLKSHIEQNTELQKIYVDKNVLQDKWHVIKIKGDTVWRTDSIAIIEQNTTHDTVYIKIQSTDTVPEIVIKEKRLNIIQQSALKSGYIFWLIIAIFISSKIIRLIFKFYGI